MPTKSSYSLLQIVLHWLIAVLIVTAWFLGDGMGRALRARLESGATGIEGNTLHVWLGSTIFALVLIRIIARAIQGAPGPLPGSTPRMEAAAIWGHRLLYLLMVLVPLLGAATWYGGVTLTGIPHKLASNLLVVVALGHVAMAIYHQHVLKDGVMTRITRPSR